MSVAELPLDLFLDQGVDTDWDRPVIRSGWKVYTDLRCLVMASTEEPDDRPDIRWRLPDIALRPFVGTLSLPPESDLIYLRREGGGEAGSCDCDGQWLRGVGRTCEACEGFGTVECALCRHEHICEACRGACRIGGKRCPVCYEVEEPRLVMKLAGRYLARRYTERLRLLPGLMFADGGGPSDVMHFRFDGGRGVVAPVSPEGIVEA